MNIPEFTAHCEEPMTWMEGGTPIEVSAHHANCGQIFQVADYSKKPKCSQKPVQCFFFILLPSIHPENIKGPM
jgi:hypothetical protein